MRLDPYLETRQMADEQRSNVKGVWWGCKVSPQARPGCGLCLTRQTSTRFLRCATTQKMQAKVFERVVQSSTPLALVCRLPSKRFTQLLTSLHPVASMGAATPQIAYTASKGAVLAMTREMAMVHAREGIRINALSP